jgi:hypothetical protein
LVYKTKLKKRTYFLPESPTIVLETLRQKLDKFGERIDDLKNLYRKNHKKPRISFFNGADGFRKIWKIIFNSGIKEYLIITDPREIPGFVQRGYIEGNIIKKKIKLNIKSRQLIAFSEYPKEIIAKDRGEGEESIEGIAACL